MDHRISDLVENLQMRSKGNIVELEIRCGYSQTPMLKSVEIDPSSVNRDRNNMRDVIFTHL